VEVFVESQEKNMSLEISASTTMEEILSAYPNPSEGVPVEATPIDALVIEAQVVEVLHTCFDPEIPVNIHELGLVYEVNVDASRAVSIKMTLTSPGCPAAQSLPAEVASKVQAIPSVSAANVEVVWNPPWDPSRMSEVARLELGMM
jgi:FeS assembly SUF system protein